MIQGTIKKFLDCNIHHLMILSLSGGKWNIFCIWPRLKNPTLIRLCCSLLIHVIDPWDAKSPGAALKVKFLWIRSLGHKVWTWKLTAQTLVNSLNERNAMDVPFDTMYNSFPRMTPMTFPVWESVHGSYGTAVQLGGTGCPGVDPDQRWASSAGRLRAMRIISW